MLTLFIFFIVAALVVTIMAGMGKGPLWVAVLILCVLEALRILGVACPRR